MSVQLRLHLPPLWQLSMDSRVDWALLRHDALLDHGQDSLRTLGARHVGVGVDACLHGQDLILLELRLPPLPARRLRQALLGEVEAMLLDDLQEIALAHGPQAADGSVPVAWLGRASVQALADTLLACGLALRGLYPTPMLLPIREGQATLQRQADHLLARLSKERGFVQLLGGHALTMEPLLARLAELDINSVRWVGSVPPEWPEHIHADAMPETEQWCGRLPGWSIPVPAPQRRSRHLAPVLLLAAAVAAALGLQLEVSMQHRQASQLRSATEQQIAKLFPEIGELVDPVAQVRRAVAAPAVRGPTPEILQLLTTSQQLIPELSGQVTALAYSSGMLELRMDTAARGWAPEDEQLAQWKQALQSRGLQLESDAAGTLRVHNAKARAP